MQFHYLNLNNNQNLPDNISLEPYKCIVLITEQVKSEWRDIVSKWLVDTGCLYMMAWGQDCSLWDDSVDTANLIAFNWSEIPEDNFVMTTWHENETLEDVFWYAKFAAIHSTVELNNILVLDIGYSHREAEIKKLYDKIGQLRYKLTMTLIRVTANISIDETELHEKFVRSSGPGGQNVNKVSTAVQLRFNVSQSQNIPHSVKMKILNSGDSRLTKEGELVLIAENFRTQEANRKDALDRLKEIIRKAAFVPKKRIPTKPSQGAKKRRLESKAKRGFVKKSRSGKIDLD